MDSEFDILGDISLFGGGYLVIYMRFRVFFMLIMQFGMIIWYLNCVFICVIGMLGNIFDIWEQLCLHFGCFLMI